MNYSFTCPACGHVVTVDAANADEAVEKLMEAGKGHAEEAHPEGPMMPEDQMKEQVKTGMVQGEVSPQPTTPTSETTPSAPQGDMNVGSTTPAPATSNEQPESEGGNSGGQPGM